MAASNVKMLFGTPVWTHFPFADYSEFNKTLALELSLCKPGNTIFDDLPGPAVKRLGGVIHDIAEALAVEYNWFYRKFSLAGHHNVVAPGSKGDTPHYHFGAKLVAIYYLSAPYNSGDLLLHDPRGGSGWSDQSAATEDTGRAGRAYHRVIPVEGLLVIVPGYVGHSVEANHSNAYRRSVAAVVETSR